MLQEMPEQHGTRAIAITGMAIAQALIAFLVGKGVVTKDQQIELYEIVLRVLEEFDGPDPGADEARKIVDAMAQFAARTPRT